MDLYSEKCDTNISRMPPLTRREVLAYLREVPGWEVEDGRLKRTFTTESFDDSLAFLNELSDLSKREEHFPDVSVTRQVFVAVSWYTYVSGGLTKNDFIMAAKMNKSARFR